MVHGLAFGMMLVRLVLPFHRSKHPGCGNGVFVCWPFQRHRTFLGHDADFFLPHNGFEAFDDDFLVLHWPTLIHGSQHQTCVLMETMRIGK
ncbi:MAG: hypothetical protein QM811_06985 [Pirellulales bacterium]